MTDAENRFAAYVAKQIDDRLAEAMVGGGFDTAAPDAGLVRHLLETDRDNGSRPKRRHRPKPL